MSNGLPRKFSDKLTSIICPHCGSKIPLSFISNLPPTATPKCPFCLKPLYSDKN